MKLTIITILSAIVAATAFAPAQSSQRASTSLHAEGQSRKAFLSAAALSVFGAAIPSAFAMDQENISDPTERWETGSPTAKAEAARVARFTNARTQFTSNFPPQKRLTLERKSPVTRLDINSPDFGAYKKTLPGLFRDK